MAALFLQTKVKNNSNDHQQMTRLTGGDVFMHWNIDQE